MASCDDDLLQRNPISSNGKIPAFVQRPATAPRRRRSPPVSTAHREIGAELGDWFSEHLTQGLASLASPDDLFNFFVDLRGIIGFGGSDPNVMDDDQIMLDPNSNIGMYVRRCLLSFNQMTFEKKKKKNAASSCCRGRRFGKMFYGIAKIYFLLLLLRRRRRLLTQCLTMVHEYGIQCTSWSLCGAEDFLCMPDDGVLE